MNCNVLLHPHWHGERPVHLMVSLVTNALFTIQINTRNDYGAGIIEAVKELSDRDQAPDDIFY